MAKLRLVRARAAQGAWAARPVTARVLVLKRFRKALARAAGTLADSIAARPAAETLVGEVLPLLEACRYLERHAAGLLAPDRRRRGAGLWLRGTEISVRREPYGAILVIGPSNYGLMLAGVQMLQALAAGNAAIVKPGPGAREPLERIAALLEQSGLPTGLVQITDESIASAEALIAAGADKIVFTGSSAAGRAVLARASTHAVPVAAELSGWDACLILDDADLERAARAIAFALAFNAGRTCLAPRRIIVPVEHSDALIAKLKAKLAAGGPVALGEATAPRVIELATEAIDDGARLVAGELSADEAMGPILLAGVTPAMRIFSTEVFASIALISTSASEADAITQANASPYGLGASVFGSHCNAMRAAAALDAGVVTINDMVVPAAHPALPIAPRRASGFGVTRGAEGLVAMTRPKAIARSRARRPRHLEPRPRAAAALFAAYAVAAHGGFGARLRLLGDGVRALRQPESSRR